VALGHELTKREKEISAEASERLGFRVLVFQDGNWICQPTGPQQLAIESTPEAAIEACRIANL
jgi:hypothetical protein